MNNSRATNKVWHTTLCVRGRLRELVEYVKITLILHLTHYTGLLQQIVRDLGTNRFTTIVEHDLEIFPLSIVNEALDL